MTPDEPVTAVELLVDVDRLLRDGLVMEEREDGVPTRYRLTWRGRAELQPDDVPLRAFVDPEARPS